MRQRYYKQKRIKKLFVVHQRGNAYEKEIFENMYQCFGSNGSLAKRMRRSAAEKRREDNDGDCKTGGFYQKMCIKIRNSPIRSDHILSGMKKQRNYQLHLRDGV